MREHALIQGRRVSAEDLCEIRTLLVLIRPVTSLTTRRVSRDWQAKYGHPIHLVETFVQPDRFRGTSYRAAGWIQVGVTTGRGRNAPTRAPQGPHKEIFLKPVHPDFRLQLMGA